MTDTILIILTALLLIVAIATRSKSNPHRTALQALPPFIDSAIDTKSPL